MATWQYRKLIWNERCGQVSELWILRPSKAVYSNLSLSYHWETKFVPFIQIFNFLSCRDIATLQIWSSDTEIAHQIWPNGRLFTKNALGMSIHKLIILPLPCTFFHLFIYFHIIFLVNSYAQLRNYQQCNTLK